MHTSSNVNELAKKFWDLWQDQVATIMNDKNFVQTLLEMMQKSPLQSPNHSAQDFFHANPFASASAPSGGDATSYNAIMAAMDECAKRLSGMERRLELLEASLIHATRKSSGTAKSARKRAAKPTVARRTNKRGK